MCVEVFSRSKLRKKAILVMKLCIKVEYNVYYMIYYVKTIVLAINIAVLSSLVAIVTFKVK